MTDRVSMLNYWTLNKAGGTVKRSNRNQRAYQTSHCTFITATLQPQPPGQAHLCKLCYRWVKCGQHQINHHPGCCKAIEVCLLLHLVTSALEMLCVFAVFSGCKWAQGRYCSYKGTQRKLWALSCFHRNACSLLSLLQLIATRRILTGTWKSASYQPWSNWGADELDAVMSNTQEKKRTNVTL